tara:strand:- start:572 stop:1003 length:432 start_codon:yes stop_codon:yes gene_type:complete
MSVFLVILDIIKGLTKNNTFMAYNRNQKHKTNSNGYQSKDGNKKPFRKKLGRYEFYVEGCPNAVRVPDSSPGTLERALKYMKRQMKDANIMEEFRDRKEFIKPSQVKRVKKAEAIRKLSYEVKKQKLAEKNHMWTCIVNGKAM